MLTVRHYPDPILRKKCAPADPNDPGLPDLIESLFETMVAEEGVGLAANQVGLDMALAVIDTSGGRDPKGRLVLLNPEILEERGEVEEEEGCLSLPGLRAKARRAEWVRVRAQSVGGDTFEIASDGLLGKALQHEIGHLYGRLFIDHLSLAQKALLSGKLKQLKKASARVA